jgi:hypothetical protein
LSAEVEVDAMAPNFRSFDRKDLSIERSGTVSVATTSPHTEFPDQRSGRLIRRSGDGGGGHHGRSVMDFSFCDEIFRSQEGRRRNEGGGGLSKFKRLVCC